jgi:hypothetical protein
VNYRALLLCILLALVLVVAAIWLLQNRVIYLPARYSMAGLIRAAEQQGVALWPSSGEQYRGLVSPLPTGSRGTVVVFHGNAGSALNRLYYMAALEHLGFKVVLAEYPGYGAREGRPSEQALVADAKATVRLVERDFSGPLYVWGESLGCGVASAVAADAGLPVRGLALITPFANLPDVAQAVYWFFPMKPLVREEYDSIANLETFQGPVAILLAEHDELIPKKHAQRIYDSLITEKRMWVFEGAGHNTWPSAPDESWWREVSDFLTRSPSGKRGFEP